MYYSAKYLPDFYERVVASIAPFGHQIEFIFVDDGSGDGATAVARGFMDGPHRVRIVELSRNFGHHPAILAGLRFVEGDLVFLIDCDLEEPPEVFGSFYRTMMAAPIDDQTDMVYGVMTERVGNFARRVSGRLFYSLIAQLLSIRVPKDAVIARLMRRRYVKALLSYNESQVYLLGLMTIVGFSQVAVAIDKADKGSTTYTFKKRAAAMLDAVTSFSDAPLYAIFWLGFLISLIAFAGGIFLVAERLFAGVRFLNGWASLMIVIIFFSGVIATSIGIMGIYVGKTFREAKRRPTYVIKDVQTNF
jgi:putative glycosyltransferase